MRWAAQIGLLSLAFAPVGQFWLAWFALVPWLIVILRTSSWKPAFLLGWASGTAFFAVNLAWLSTATAPGAVAACIALGLSWGIVAIAIRAIGPSDHAISI